MENKNNFTPRELDIIEYMSQGLNNAEIAKKLFISIHTVKSHLESMYEKIEQEYFNGEPLSNHFNLITGTSTGGIIALALSTGASAKEIKQFYLRHGEKIFPKKKKRKSKI